MKKLISFALVTVMLFCMFPIAALAESVSYADVDYTEKFEIGGYNTSIESSDPYVEIPEYSRNGYAKAFSLTLTEGKLYYFGAFLYTQNATSGGISFYLFSNISGSFYSDILFSDSSSIYYNSAGCSDIFSCDKTGTYYLLVIAEASDENGSLFGTDATELSIEVYEYDNYTKTDFSEKITVGEDKNLSFSLSDPEIVYSFDYSDIYGYANGVTVELEADTYYSLSLSSDNPNAFFYGGVALLSENLSGDIYEDVFLVEEATSVDKLYFYVDKAGTYKLLINGYVEDDSYNSLITAEGIDIALNVSKATFETVEISTVDDLVKFNMDLYEEKFESTVIKAIIKNDIDMSNTEWVPIDSYYQDIIVIEGNENTIIGLHDSLFGDIYGCIVGIYDLTVDIDYSFDNVEEGAGDTAAFANIAYSTFVLDNCHATGKISLNARYIEDVGSFAGELCNLVYIDGCTSSVNFDLTAVESIGYVGGINGYYYSEYKCSSIENTSWDGTINASCDSKAYTESIGNIGGFTGDSGYNLKYKNCSATGEISLTVGDANSANYIGGFVGYVEDYCTFENCFADVDITAEKGECVGGFAGYIDEENLFKNCYSSGSVSAYEVVGGFVGESYCCGNNLFLNCYSTSDVSAENCVGGFIGMFYYGDSFVNCYTSGTVKATLTDDPATPENELDWLAAGSFFGFGEYDAEVDPFDNCFAFKSDLGFGIVIDYDIDELVKFEGDSLTEVDFSLDVVVDAMTAVLNKKVEELTDSGFEGLLNWGEKNEDNGPILMKPEEPENPENPGDNPGEGEPEEPTYLLGDVDGDNDVDANDYIVLKRIYFGQAKLENLKNPETALVRSDVTKDGKIDANDYILLKRVYFGQAKL